MPGREGCCKVFMLVSARGMGTMVRSTITMGANLVYLGLKKPDQDYSAYYRKLQQMPEKLPTTVLCLAAEEVAFDLILMLDT